jgi:hypothetical protein
MAWKFYTDRVPPELWIYTDYLAAIDELRRTSPDVRYHSDCRTDFERSRPRRLSGEPEPRLESVHATVIFLAFRMLSGGLITREQHDDFRRRLDEPVQSRDKALLDELHAIDARTPKANSPHGGDA